jgi:hypothetical protein
MRLDPWTPLTPSTLVVQATMPVASVFGATPTVAGLQTGAAAAATVATAFTTIEFALDPRGRRSCLAERACSEFGFTAHAQHAAKVASVLNV